VWNGTAPTSTRRASPIPRTAHRASRGRRGGSVFSPRRSTRCTWLRPCQIRHRGTTCTRNDRTAPGSGRRAGPGSTSRSAMAPRVRNGELQPLVFAGESHRVRPPSRLTSEVTRDDDTRGEYEGALGVRWSMRTGGRDRQTLVCDGDDTLWENNRYFERAI